MFKTQTFDELDTALILKVLDRLSQLLLSMLGAVYQFERNIMLERQREGIAIAKANPRYGAITEVQVA
jgi:DNA invertase Pin-like site-specific DNA recombinase